MLSPCFILKASNSTVSTFRHQSVIPNKFSKKIMEAINLGILTKGMRTEVINMIAVQMLQETLYPKSEDYTEVCRKLVEMYPVLKDTIGNGYVSIIGLD